MKLKLDESGKVVLLDGKPVYVHEDGKELPFDAAQAFAKIGELNREAKGHRERAEAAEQKLKSFDGIEDSDAAKRALEIVKNLDVKKLIDADDVEKMRQEVIKAVTERYDAQVKSLTQERDEAKKTLSDELIGGAFARSPMITGDNATLAIPADMVQAKFGPLFKVEDGNVIGYVGKEPIYSRVNPGEIAGFDEALGILIDQYPHKDSIIKGSGAQGGGAYGNSGSSNSKSINRAAFDVLPPSDKMGFMKNGGKIID